MSIFVSLPTNDRYFEESMLCKHEKGILGNRYPCIWIEYNEHPTEKKIVQTGIDGYTKYLKNGFIIHKEEE